MMGFPMPVSEGVLATSIAYDDGTSPWPAWTVRMREPNYYIARTRYGERLYEIHLGWALREIGWKLTFCSWKEGERIRVAREFFPGPKDEALRAANARVRWIEDNFMAIMALDEL